MTNQSMLSTPALVLTIGTSMASAISEVERIFFQSDPRRKASTHFLALSSHSKKGDTELVSISEVTQSKTSISWKEAYEQANSLADNLKSGIRSALHELRSHKKLLEVGLGGKTTLPLDVILIADLAEGDASALLVILPLIQSLLMDEPYTKVHLLLNTAVFDEDLLAEANVYDSLKDIRGLLNGCEHFNLPQAYLFDRYKEGAWEAHDALEVQTILGNFLLALLSGGLAQYLAHQVSQVDVEENHAYFNGASATALVFDVDQLQKACAMRLASEILASEFHSQIIPDPTPVEELAGEFAANHANQQTWTMRLCRDSLFHAHAGGLGLELHFSDLRFEDVPMEDWVKTIQARDSLFKEKHLPTQCDVLNKNVAELDREFLEQLTAFTQSLPQQMRLYPGGLRASKLTLERIRRTLQSEQSIPADLSALDQDWAVRVKTSLETLEKSMSLLPKPPRWVFRLPSILRKPAIQLFNLIFLHAELKALLDLRQTSVFLLEQKYAVWMEESLTQNLTDLCKSWVSALDKQIRSLKHLQSTFDKLQTCFADKTTSLISSPSMFRPSVLNEAVLSWAYYHGKRPEDGFRHALLNEWKFLDEWQKTGSKVFEERLDAFCRQVYQPLQNIDMEEVLHHRNGMTPDDLASALSQGAVPLLRPNFDQTGSGSSYQMQFYQSKDPCSSSILPILKGDMQEWQEVATDDAYIAICCRVRMMIPLSALIHVFERGQPAYDALDKSIKGEFQIEEHK
jgi:hypothetical protein